LFLFVVLLLYACLVAGKRARGAVPFQRERVSLLKEGDHPAERESCSVLWETGGDFTGETNTKNIPSDESITEK